MLAAKGFSAIGTGTPILKRHKFMTRFQRRLSLKKERGESTKSCLSLYTYFLLLYHLLNLLSFQRHFFMTPASSFCDAYKESGLTDELAGMKLVFWKKIPQGRTGFTCTGSSTNHISIKLCKEFYEIVLLKGSNNLLLGQAETFKGRNPVTNWRRST